jgi:hypothetical protein
LSTTNKVTLGKKRRVLVQNAETGEGWEIDPDAARLSRLRRRVHAWADALRDYTQDNRKYRKVMITLTYRPGVEWQPGHIRVFMRRLRKRLRAALVAYAWVAEMQRRGAVHYHVLLVVRRGASIPRPDDAGLWSMV